MKKVKGGIEGIIALVILVGIVIALIIATVLPIANEGKNLGDAGKEKISGLASIISSD